jgi:hypothetical protein
MKHVSASFLKAVLILATVLTAAFLIWFPRVEGRATNLDLISIYSDPFIIYIYLSSIPFFLAIRQAYKLLGYIENDKTFSQGFVDAIKTIKYCGIIAIACVMAAQAYLFIVQHSKSDDIAGGVMSGFIILFVSTVVTAAAELFQKIFQEERKVS